MATKTISIDLDAYGILSSCKGKKESFSDVIKRTKFAPAAGTAESLLSRTAFIKPIKNKGRKLWEEFEDRIPEDPWKD